MMRLARSFLRALLLRCPHCGRAGLLHSWFRMRERCPGCGLRVERGEGEDYFLGGMMFNIVLSELVFVIGMVVWLVLTWPTPPWTLIELVGIPFMVVAPVLFYPVSRTVWLAFDLAFRPVRPDDLAPDDTSHAPRAIP